MGDRLGIDGCAAGWFVAALGEDGEIRWRCERTLVELLQGERRPWLALIDMPVGLARGARECDRLARARLGARRSSVFSPPARATLAARDYAEALRLNRQHAGTGLSKQAWNIVPKIREVDALLQAQPALRGRLRESHPELAFASLNAGEPMAHNKRTVQGREERLQVLEARLPAARRFLEDVLASTRRREVAADDVLDALVLAVVAREGEGRLATLPAQPPRDETGLAMEMVYREWEGWGQARRKPR